MRADSARVAVVAVALASLVVACGVRPSQTVASANAPTPPPATQGHVSPPSPSGDGFAPDSVVGVSLPGTGADEWKAVGDEFVAQLGAAGFAPDVRYSNFSLETQGEQIGSLAHDGAEVIFIFDVYDEVPIDYYLADAADAANAAGATVIEVGITLSQATGVAFHLGYNPRDLGKLDAEMLLQGLQERLPGRSSYNIEILSGDPADPASESFYKSAMGVLRPKIADGTLVVPSGQTAFDDTTTYDNSGFHYTQERMIPLLSSTYGDRPLDGLLVHDDVLARGMLAMCDDLGLGTPVVTGAGSSAASVASIMEGVQYSTTYEPNLGLVAPAVSMAQALQRGEMPPINDKKSIDNGLYKVPAYLVPPIGVTKANAADVLRSDANLYAITQR